MKNSFSTKTKGNAFFNGISKLVGVAKRNIRPMDAYKFIKHYLGKSIIDAEIDKVTSLSLNSRRNLYFTKKNCLVPDYYKSFTLGKEKNTVIYKGKEYKLTEVFVAYSEKNDYHFKTKEGDYLYQILGLKTKKEDKSIAVLWLKNNEISQKNEEDNGKLIQTVFSGNIESPFALQSVNPRTKKSNVIATVLLFPFGFTARAIKYIGFKVPALLFGIVDYGFKGCIYGAFFVFSMPFLVFKSVREANKNLLYQLLGKQSMSLEEIKSQDLARKDGSLITDSDLKNQSMVLMITKSFSSFLNVMQKPISFALNIVASLIQGGVNLFNSLIYSDNGYADVAKQQVKQSFVNFKDAVKDSFIVFIHDIKGFKKTTDIEDSNKVELMKKDVADEKRPEAFKMENVLRDITKQDEFKKLSDILQEAGVSEKKGEISYYSKATDNSPVLNMKNVKHHVPSPA